MTYYYSPTTKGFYTDELVYPEFPKDAIKLSDNRYHELLKNVNQNNKDIMFVDNKLILIERMPVNNWDIIRRKRNMLLKKTDYTQMPDYPGDKKAYAVYRQTLRDIPQIFSSPENVVWPTDPSEKPKQST
jgi:hypothetical protein